MCSIIQNNVYKTDDPKRKREPTMFKRTTATDDSIVGSNLSAYPFQ